VSSISGNGKGELNNKALCLLVLLIQTSLPKLDEFVAVIKKVAFFLLKNKTITRALVFNDWLDFLLFLFFICKE